MPMYVFRCDACSHGFEEVLRFSDPHPAACPECGAGEPDFHQDFQAVNPIGIVKGEPTTVGGWSDYNKKRLGKERVAEIASQEKETRSKRTFTGTLPEGAKVIERQEAETPWFRDGSVAGVPKLDKPLNLRKVRDINKYIKTGEAK